MLCLESATAIARVAATAFTLIWTHSVEKTRWEEDWHLSGGELVVVAARVEGSGAGMEPPPDARRQGRFWTWRPSLPPQRDLRLATSGIGEWTLCAGGACRTFGEIVPQANGTVTLRPCE
jgi:hypothetical protein